MYKPDNIKLVATIECRMTSSRLPGKVMLEACGKPMLELMAERVAKVEQIDRIVFATTTNATDDCIEELTGKIGVGCYRGPEDDVLLRVLEAARDSGADVIVELTGDCPVIDPDIISHVIDTYFINDCDYADNVTAPGFPLGMAVQVFSTDTLARCDEEGKLPEDREHVSWYIRRRPEIFRHVHIPAPENLYWPDLRLTLDEKEDYAVIKNVFESLYPSNKHFSLGDVIDYLRKNPQIAAINAGVAQKHVG